MAQSSSAGGRLFILLTLIGLATAPPARADSCTASADVCIEFNLNTYHGNWYPPDEEDISLGGGYHFDPDANLYPNETRSWGFNNGNRAGRAVSLVSVDSGQGTRNVDGSAAGDRVADTFRGSHPELSDTPQQRHDEAFASAPPPTCEPGACGTGGEPAPGATCEIPVDTGPAVEPGAEAKDGPGSDPVDARDGEFYTSDTDLALDGAGIRFAHTRYYRSRLAFDGTMGFAWDHGLNQRIVASHSVKCEQEVLYMTGKGTVVRFRHAGEMLYFPTSPGAAPEYAVTYSAPRGFAGVLRGYKRTHVANSPSGPIDITAMIWTMTWPDGKVARFDTNGNLRRLEDANGIGLDLSWEVAPRPIAWRVKQVTDSGGRVAKYSYNAAGLLREVAISGSDLKSSYVYSGHDLTEVTKATGRTEIYIYDAGHVDNGDQPPFVPEGQLQATCELACAPSSSSCDAGGGCDTVLQKCDEACGSCDSNCVAACPDACADACRTGSSAGPGCTSQCAAQCTPDKINDLCGKIYRGEITSGDGSSEITPQRYCEQCDLDVHYQCIAAKQNNCNMIATCLAGCAPSLLSSNVDYGTCTANCIGDSLNPLDPELYKELGQEIGLAIGMTLLRAWDTLHCWGGRVVEAVCWVFDCDYEADCDPSRYAKQWAAEACNQHCYTCLAYGDECADGSCNAGHTCADECRRGFMGQPSGTTCQLPGGFDPAGGFEPSAGGCPDQLHDECPAACEANCLGKCTPSCEPQCEARCAYDCSTCRPTCEAEALPACTSGCIDGCIAKAHEESGGVRYGKPSDLNHNLIHAFYLGKTGMPIKYLDLTYGQNPGLADFDTVVSQQNGDDTLSFHYRDYDAEAHGFPRPTDLMLLGNTVDAPQFQAVDICPSNCTAATPSPSAGLFYPLGNMLVTFPTATSAALERVKLLGIAAPAVPLMTLRFEKPDANKPAVYARGLGGLKALPSAFELSILVEGKRAVINRDPTQADRLQVTASSTTLDRLVRTTKEITVFTDKGGLLRAVVGHPSAILALSEGACNRPFTASSTRDGLAQLAPADACSQSFVVSPLANAVPYATALPRGLASVDDLAKSDFFAASSLTPGRFSVRWTQAAGGTAGSYVPSVGPEGGRAPASLAAASQAAVEQSALLRAPIEGPADRDVYVFHVPAALRADGLPFRPDVALPSQPLVGAGSPFALFDAPAEWRLGGQMICSPILFTGPNWGAAGAASGRPARATAEVDPYGVAWTLYFDHEGQLIREVNHSTGATRSFNYDSNRNLSAVLEPLGDRACLSYDVHGNLTSVARHPAPDAPGGAVPVVEKFEYSSFPERLTKIFDPRDGTSVLRRFDYDAKGNLTKIHEATGEDTSYIPGPNGQPTTVVGPDGTVTRLAYSPYSSVPKEVTVDATGNAPQTTSRTYDNFGRLTHQVTPLGETVDLTWEGMHTLTIDRAAPGGLLVSTRLGYNPDGQLASTASGDLTIDLDYDKHGEVNVITASGPRLETQRSCLVRGADHRVLERVAPDGSRVQLFYDGEGRPTLIQAGALASAYTTPCDAYEGPSPVAAVVSQRTYDLDGHVKLSTAADGRSESVTYDGLGRAIIVRAEVPGGAVIRRGYDAMGHVVWEATYSVAAANLAYGPPALADVGLLSVTEFGYDAGGRQNKVDRWAFYPTTKQLIGDGHQVTQIALQPAQRRVTVTDDLGQTTTQSYDPLGRPSQTVTPGGETVSFDYLDGGTTVRERWPAPTPTGQMIRTTRYTAWGVPSSVTMQSSTTPSRQWSYYADGSLHTVTDASGATTTFGYDPLHRPVTQSKVNGDGTYETLTVGYQNGGRVASRTSATERNSTTTSYAYDALGRLTSTTFPTGTVHAVGYVDGSALIDHEDLPSGVHLRHAWSDTTAGRVHSVSATGAAWGDESRTYTFDPAGRLVAARDSASKLGDSTDDYTTSLSYNSLGLVYNETGVTPGSPDNVVTTERDLLGRATTVTLAGTAVKRSYDADGRLTQLRLGSSSSPVEVAFAYSGLGGPTTRTLRSGLVTAYGYDALARLDSVQDGTLSEQHWYRPLDGVPRFTTSRRGAAAAVASVFGLDPAGRLHEEGQDLRTIGSIATSLAPDATFESARQVVTNAFGASEPYPHRKWALDGRDNWTSMSGGPDLSTTIGDDDQYEAFGRDGVSLNADGSVAKVTDEVYQWNAFGELAQASKGDRTRRYGRDAMGRVVEETDLATGAKTRYGYNGLARVIERAPGGLAITVDGDGTDQHLLRISGTQKYYYHQDGQGSVYLLTGTGGTPAEWYKYTAYGVTTIQNAAGAPVAVSPTGNRFAFQGGPYDADLGLVDMRARPYRPAWGRFLSPDPSDYNDGSNRFAFVGSAPTAWTDPLGLGREDPAFEEEWDQAVRDANAEMAQFEIGKLNDALFWEGVHSYTDPVTSYLNNSAADFNHRLWIMGPKQIFEAIDDFGDLMCGDSRCLMLIDPLAGVGSTAGEVEAVAGIGEVAVTASRLAPAATRTERAVAGVEEVVGLSKVEEALEIAGAEGGKVAPFNPSGSKLNCVNGVCAFIESVQNGRLVEASADVAWNGGSIRRANAQIVARTGVRMSETAQFNTLNTGYSRQFFVVYPGRSADVAQHVLIGINNNGKTLLYDPQTGQRFWNLQDFGPFVAYPIIW